MKTRKCKHCKEPFTPWNLLQKYCLKNYCVSVMIEDKQKKEWAKRKAKMKADLMTASDYKKLAQTVFNQYIRLRDKDLNCISCDKPLKQGNVDAGHLWSSGGHANITFNEYNVNAQCSRPCNKDKSGDTNNYRINFVKRYSKEILDELDSLAHIEKKWSIEELKNLIHKYKEEVKILKKNM